MNPPTDLSARLDALDRKLDLVLEEIDAIRRVRREIDELRDDLTRVGRDLIPTLASELEDVAPHVRPADIVALLKQTLRNVDTLNASLTQLQGAREFIQEATPIARQLMGDAVSKLDEMDRKGYFAMAHELQRGLDRVVTTFTVEDVRLLADNLTAILSTVKNLTQPEMLQAINNATEIYKQLDFESLEEFSPWRAFREINKPEMRRGIGFLVVFLRNLSANLATTSNTRRNPTA